MNIDLWHCILMTSFICIWYPSSVPLFIKVDTFIVVPERLVISLGLDLTRISVGLSHLSRNKAKQQRTLQRINRDSFAVVDPANQRSIPMSNNDGASEAETGEEWMETQEAEPEEEDEEAYRLRVYGTTDTKGEALQPRTLVPRGSRQDSGSFRRFSKSVSRQVSRQSSVIVESLPETPAGWTVLVSSVLSAVLGYEMKLQKSLTTPPITFGQLHSGGTMGSVYQKMTATADSILSRSIQPSLFVGTRGIVASTAAYLLGGPSKTEEHLRFREILTMTQDGAKIGVDWEVPCQTKGGPELSVEERKAQILKGPIREPVIIVFHGINNDASFGYVKSLQRTFADRGWNAAAMNFRGVGGVPLTTPRGYNAAYTGDIRCLVHHISGRLAKDVPIFLVGNSLGANIMAKYLGEEGLSETLPACVAGATSLGNPLQIHSMNIPFPFSVVMALGVKKIYVQNWGILSKINDSFFKQTIMKGFRQASIGNFDCTVAPILIRNEEYYPFAVKTGFKSGEDYWHSSSSYRHVRSVSVPFLNLTAGDDFLVSKPSRNRIGYCLANPNIMVVETRCGGHLGWQESPPEQDGFLNFGASSWADTASADFFEAVMQTNVEKTGSPVGRKDGNPFPMIPGCEEADIASHTQKIKEEAVHSSSQIRSRL
jgi:predicted alpha/beta-fold hydrolase